MSCQIEACTKLAKAKGWCSMHYARWARHGDPLTVLTVHGNPANVYQGPNYRTCRICRGR